MGLSVHKLCYAYEDGFSLSAISFDAENGRVLGIIGANGSGKSTLLECVVGLRKPLDGTIWIDGKDYSSMRRREVARHVGYVPQNHAPAFPFRVADVVLMGRCPHLRTLESPSKADQEIAQGKLQELGLGHLAGRSYTRVSGGERRLVMIARALTQEAAIIVLDEPTAYLDFRNRQQVIHTLSELASRGTAVVMTLHDPTDALECCDDALLLCDGATVACGPSCEVITEENLSRAYNVAIRRLDQPRFVVDSYH
ncbi:MAG: ABC transporter ATP-binding protein [Candidatus Brocadiae bacterium]|nr:ABC transporter ATP-binding protein [Candidatus Brocadiia bacterium]